MILGAGNSNDVALSLLAKEVNEIHLVDIDREALTRAYKKCSSEAKRKIFLHPNVDLSTHGTRHPLPDFILKKVGTIGNSNIRFLSHCIFISIRIIQQQ